MGQLETTDNRLTQGARTPDEMRSLLQTIDQLPFYMGAKPFDAEIEIIMIANFIIKKYPSLSPKQLVEAMEDAAAGELWLDGKRVQARTYGNQLNIDVLGTILTAWREKDRQRRAAPKPVLPKSHRIEAPVDLATPEWHYDNLIKEIAEEGKMPAYRPFSIIHAHMVEQGMLKKLPPQPTESRFKARVRALSDEIAKDPYRDSIAAYLRKTGIIKT